MLLRAEKTQDDVMGNSGQGIYWQGSDKTHRPDETHRMGGLGTWCHAEGCPMPVLLTKLWPFIGIFEHSLMRNY